MVKAELDGKSEKEIAKIAGDGKTTTCALLWLVRALYFILKMLDPLVNEPDKTLSACVLAGYEVSLKPHHGMMIRGTFSMAVKAAPRLGDNSTCRNYEEESQPQSREIVRNGAATLDDGRQRRRPRGAPPSRRRV